MRYDENGISEEHWDDPRYHRDAFDEPETDITEEFGLPELPPLIDPCNTDENTRELVLYRFKEDNIPLGYVTEEDAHYYCQRDDTHDTSGEWCNWFVGFRRIV